MKTNERTKRQDLATQLEQLMNATVQVSGFSKETLLSQARFREIAEYRMVFYYLAITLLGAKLEQVAEFTERTPGAVLNGFRRIRSLMMYYDINSKVKQIRYDFLSSNNPASEH